MKDKILGLAGLRLVYELVNERELPKELRPPGMPEDRGHPWPQTHEFLVIERSRHDIRSHGPLDTLTVTLGNLVDRDWGLFADYNEKGYPLDKDAVCTAMDFKQTWTDVSKIRFSPEFWVTQANFELKLVMQGKDGEEIVSIPPTHNFILFGNERMQRFARRLTDELHLRHAVVDRVHEFSVV